VVDFEDAVAEVVLGLAEGQVVSYGWVAAEAGYPGRARAVGRFLAQHGHGLPWWRVVRANGSLVAPDPDRQAQALRAEGVQVEGRRVLSPLPAQRPANGGEPVGND
jgi:methylated-DNA-protein-cysteine methyltransferase-like protein